MLEANLIESDAFLNLSGKAALLCLIRFHQKAYKKRTSRKNGDSKRLVITNNGEIIFTYAEARELGISSTRTFYKVLREMIEEKGFIDIAELSKWYEKKPTKFAISERWRKYGTDEYEKTAIKRLLPGGVGFQKTKEPLPE